MSTSVAPAARPYFALPRLADGPVTAWVIANPSAGRAGRRAALEDAVDLWVVRGWSVEWRWTSGPGDATALARAAAAAGVDVVAVAGGDGTVNEAANGLVGTDTALAVLPAGTANVLAAQLGLVGYPSPLRTPDLSAAAAALAAGQVRCVDVGWAEPSGMPGRYFLMWAGIGVDAAVVAALEGPARALKARIGPWAYVWVGLRTLARDRGGEAVVRLDGRRRRGRLRGAVVSNVPLYTGLLHLAPEATVDDGRLDAAVFFGATYSGALRAWLTGGGVKSPVAFVRRVVLGRGNPARPLATPVRRMRIVGRPRLCVHVDAEPWGRTPVRIRVCPGALRLVVPSCAPPNLFAVAPAAQRPVALRDRTRR